MWPPAGPGPGDAEGLPQGVHAADEARWLPGLLPPEDGPPPSELPTLEDLLADSAPAAAGSHDLPAHDWLQLQDFPQDLQAFVHSLGTTPAGASEAHLEAPAQSLQPAVQSSASQEAGPSQVAVAEPSPVERPGPPSLQSFQFQLPNFSLPFDRRQPAPLSGERPQPATWSAERRGPASSSTDRRQPGQAPSWPSTQESPVAARRPRPMSFAGMPSSAAGWQQWMRPQSRGSFSSETDMDVDAGSGGASASASVAASGLAAERMHSPASFSLSLSHEHGANASRLHNLPEEALDENPTRLLSELSITETPPPAGPHRSSVRSVQSLSFSPGELGPYRRPLRRVHTGGSLPSSAGSLAPRTIVPLSRRRSPVQPLHALHAEQPLHTSHTSYTSHTSREEDTSLEASRAESSFEGGPTSTTYDSWLFDESIAMNRKSLDTPLSSPANSSVHDVRPASRSTGARPRPRPLSMIAMPSTQKEPHTLEQYRARAGTVSEAKPDRYEEVRAALETLRRFVAQSHGDSPARSASTLERAPSAARTLRHPARASLPPRGQFKEDAAHHERMRVLHDVSERIKDLKKRSEDYVRSRVSGSDLHSQHQHQHQHQRGASSHSQR